MNWSLALCVVVAIGIYWALQNQSVSDTKEAPLIGELSPVSLEEASPLVTHDEGKVKVARKNVPAPGASTLHFIHVIVEDEKGQPIPGAEIAWHLGEEKTEVKEWSSVRGKGLEIEMPQEAGTLIAQADGYLSNGFGWRPGQKQASLLRMVLVKVDIYQAITCLDSRTQEPIAGVRFSCFGTIVKHESVAGEWVSNAEGIVQLPRSKYSGLSFVNEVPVNTDFASMHYSIDAATDVLEIFHQGLGRVTVVDEAGTPLAGIPVGANADQADFSGGGDARFPIADQTTDQDGQATFPMLLNADHKVWAKHKELGYFQQKVTPTEDSTNIRFQLTQQPSLVLKVEIPSGVAPQSLQVKMAKAGKEIVTFRRGEDGLFTIPTPLLNRRLSVSAEGCVSVSGYLNAQPADSLYDPAFSGGFVSLSLRRGYEIEGRTIWSDGKPADVNLGLFTIDENRPPYEVVDQQYATGWRWSEHHPKLEVQTGSRGEFRFTGLPAATYCLNQALEGNPLQNGYASLVGTCSFVPAHNFLVIPGAGNPVLTIPRFQQSILRVRNAKTKNLVSTFMVQREVPKDANGFHGSAAEGRSGVFQGWMDVDDLSLLKLTSEGYLPTFLDKAKVQRTADLWEMEIEMEPINPGRITVYFLPPDGDPNFRAWIQIKATEPEYWSEAFFFEKGVTREIPIPTDGSASVQFTLYSKGYALSETQWDYDAGESISLYLNESKREW